MLKAWGVPAKFQIAATRVRDPLEPNLIAECAALLVLRKDHGRLRARREGRRPTLREKSNALWIIHAPIVRAADNVLVIGALTIGPAFEEQLSQQGDDNANGVTSELLRLLSPARLLNEAVRYLERQNYHASRLRDEATKPNQKPPNRRPPKTRQPYVSEEDIIAIAKRYITLCTLGKRHPLDQLAHEFGISRTQARDRVHKARTLQYIGAVKQGRAGGGIGPRLRQLGWSPPSTPGK